MGGYLGGEGVSAVMGGNVDVLVCCVVFCVCFGGWMYGCTL